MKRYLLVITAVIVLLGLGTVLYFYFFSKAPSVSVTPGGAELPGSSDQASPTPTSTEPPAPAAAVSARLVKVSKGPVVAGVVVTNHKSASASSSPEAVVHYIERQSGNVFSYDATTHTVTRTSNKTIPGIQSAAWLADASTAYVRYLGGDTFNTISTYGLNATSSAGFFLAQNLADIATVGANVLTLASGVNGSVVSTINPDGTNPRPVFSTPLSSVRASFAGKGAYLVSTKASGLLSGDAFLYRNGVLSRVAGPHAGLVALASPQGKWVLVSYSGANDTLQMELVNAVSAEVISLPVATIADKCVWAADDSALYCGIPTETAGATYPDDWYQGVVHFADRIWKINVADRFAQRILDFTAETEASLDATSLAIDPAQTLLTFINKNDGSLWSYSL